MIGGLLGLPNVGGFAGAGYGNGSGGSGSGASGGLVLFCPLDPCNECNQKNSQGSCIGGRNFLPGYIVGGIIGGGFPNPPQTCLASGSSIVLSDGSEITIGELRVGQLIKGLNCDGEHAAQTVKAIKEFESEVVRVSFGSGYVDCTLSHMFIQPNINEIYASELKIGDELLGIENNVESVERIERIDEKVKVYAIEVEPHHMYFANGIAHHNKVYCLANLEDIPVPY